MLGYTHFIKLKVIATRVDVFHIQKRAVKNEIILYFSQLFSKISLTPALTAV